MDLLNLALNSTFDYTTIEVIAWISNYIPHKIFDVII